MLMLNSDNDFYAFKTFIMSLLPIWSLSLAPNFKGSKFLQFSILCCNLSIITWNCWYSQGSQIAISSNSRGFRGIDIIMWFELQQQFDHMILLFRLPVVISSLHNLILCLPQSCGQLQFGVSEAMLLSSVLKTWNCTILRTKLYRTICLLLRNFELEMIT